MELLSCILIIIIIIVINRIENKQKEQRKNEKKEQKIVTEKKENLPYKLYKNIFTDNERFFYKVLKEITYNMDIIIMTKVRLADIIYTNEYEYTYFNKIKSKHIDFVLIDSNGKIKLLIELDDKSHEKHERKERDKFLNKIFENSNINLLRIPAKYIYNTEELKNKIKESL